MTTRRLDRKRLYEVEKLGQSVNVGASVGMKNAITSSTQHREGHKLTTDIVVDLGTSKDVVKTGGVTAGMPVGTEDGSGVAELSYVAQLTSAVFGVVTSVEVVCLEVPTDGVLAGTTANAYQLEIGDNNGKIGVAVANPVTIHADMDSVGDEVGAHSLTNANDSTMAAGTLLNKYVYIATGAGAGAETTATATITVTDTDVSNLTSAATYIRLTKADGTPVDYFAASGGNFDAANTTNNTFNIGGTVDTAAKLARGIAIGINGDASIFTASPVDGSSATITVTQTAAGVGGNETNFKVDAPSQTSGITVGDFVGGTTAGTSTAMTAGKFLIRVTGFAEPSDI